MVTFGHSIGGQFLGLLRNHALARAHVQIATSIGYWRWEHAPFKYLAWWFWRVHGPLMLALKGYIPTGGGWAGLPLPRGVYEEWRRWCLRPDHFGPDLAHLSGRQLLRRDPRARCSPWASPTIAIATRRTVDATQQVLPERRARIALVFAGRCGFEAHRPRRILRLEASRHAVASGARLDRRQTRGRAHERSAGTPADHITPYDRLALDEASLVALLASGTPQRGPGRIFRCRAARGAREAGARHHAQTQDTRRAAPARVCTARHHGLAARLHPRRQTAQRHPVARSHRHRLRPPDRAPAERRVARRRRSAR